MKKKKFKEVESLKSIRLRGGYTEVLASSYNGAMYSGDDKSPIRCLRLRVIQDKDVDTDLFSDKEYDEGEEPRTHFWMMDVHDAESIVELMLSFPDIRELRKQRLVKEHKKREADCYKTGDRPPDKGPEDPWMVLESDDMEGTALFLKKSNERLLEEIDKLREELIIAERRINSHMEHPD